MQELPGLGRAGVTGDEGCMAMVAAPKGCSDDPEMWDGSTALADPVCPAPTANIAKQLGRAADCGTGRQLIEQLGQKEFCPVLWVSVKRRQSKLEAFADIFGPIGLMFGLLSIGGVQGVASLILSLNLIIQFVQLGLPDKFRKFADSFTDVMTVAKIGKFDFDSLKIVRKIVVPVLNAFEHPFSTNVVAEEVLVPAVGAPQTGWCVDRFPRGPARTAADHRQGRPEGDKGVVAC